MDRAGCLAERSQAGGERVADLRVTFAPAGLAGAYVEAPWKLFGPVGPTGRRPDYFLTNSTAGILAGDRLTASFDLQPGTNLRLAAPSATRVHTMGPGESASQRLEFNLEAGARLAFWPNQLIPFAGADYRQETIFRLAPDASLVAADILAPGRLGSGEAFAFTSLRLSARIYLGGRLVLADQALLRPGESAPGRPGLWEGYTHAGSLYRAWAAALSADLDALAARLEETTAAGAPVLAGLSRPDPRVVVVRVLGMGTEAVAGLVGRLAPGLWQ